MTECLPTADDDLVDVDDFDAFRCHDESNLAPFQLDRVLHEDLATPALPLAALICCFFVRFAPKRIGLRLLTC